MAAELLELVSSQVWANISRYHKNGVSYGEDAITSALLVEIAEASPMNLLLRDTRPREGVKGCDFDLWIGSSSRGWYRYAVQAKKIDVPSEGYPKLNHKVGEHEEPQIDILERYAGQGGATPLYCFYNYVARPITEWNCKLPKDDEQLGCTVAPSSVVRAALSMYGRRNFHSIHSDQRTRPLRCLWRCPDMLPQGAGHDAPHDRVFGNQVWREVLPPQIRWSIDGPRRTAFGRLVETGFFGEGSDRLLPRYLAVLDTSSLTNG
ncbi:DUF6615 family protein [Ralstonia pseudosolanacearum]